MRLSLAILFAGSAVVVNGFSGLNTPAFHTAVKKSSSSVLYAGSWGNFEPPTPTGTLERTNPEQRATGYVKEAEAVEARNTIDGKCLVSGLVNTQERTDQTIFDMLNDQDSAFEFEKLIAFVDDESFAKKRLFSRSARYTGLMDKLEFASPESPGGLPTADQFKGVTSWIAVLEAGGETDVLDTVQSIAAIAKEAASVKNVNILITNGIGLDTSKSEEALESLKGDDFAFTVVVVGKLEDRPDGSVPYKYETFATAEGVLEEDAVFSRDESLRMITDMLQLESGVGKALAFSEVYDVNATEAKLIKGLREAGYARMQEIDHMVQDGPKKYKEYIEQWKTQNPDWEKGYTSDIWWEGEEFQKSVKARARKEETEIVRLKDERTEEVEKIAKEWAKREFFRQSMSGAIVSSNTSEEDYIKSVWDRAMFEADLVYRQMKGEIVDPSDEYADFNAKQERKQQIMLQRAKEELAEMLDEENLGGEEVLKALTSAEEEAEANENKDVFKKD